MVNKGLTISAATFHGEWSAYWRMPSPKKLDEMVRKRAEQSPAETDDGWWTSVFNDPRAAGAPRLPIQQYRLNEILRYILRVSCLRPQRIVESRRRMRCACTVGTLSGKMSDRNC
jgi:hypothetical protein